MGFQVASVEIVPAHIALHDWRCLCLLRSSLFLAAGLHRCISVTGSLTSTASTREHRGQRISRATIYPGCVSMEAEARKDLLRQSTGHSRLGYTANSFSNAFPRRNHGRSTLCI